MWDLRMDNLDRIKICNLEEYKLGSDNLVKAVYKELEPLIERVNKIEKINNVLRK
jgi:hypothetical protein